MTSAERAGGTPPTPEPRAGKAMDDILCFSAMASDERVAAMTLSTSALRSCPMVAAWMTEFLRGHLVELPALGGHGRLFLPESARKRVRRLPEGVLGVNVQQPHNIDEREEEISERGPDPRGVSPTDGLVGLRQFLPDL